MKSEARKLLEEMVESWRDFDLAMKGMASGNYLTSEEQHYLRLGKASERWQRALGSAAAYLEKKN